MTTIEFSRKFLVHLEFKMSRSLKHHPNKFLNRFWCDGIIPDVYAVVSTRPAVSGRIWIVEGQHQMKWSFRLLLGLEPERLQGLNERSLAPDELSLSWFHLDLESQHVEMRLPDPRATTWISDLR